jgi:DNA polymerase-3 subunit epsilon
MNRYAVSDFETTGLSPGQGDRAVEIGVVLLENGQVIDTYESLINPNVLVSSFITDLTGISNRMIRDAPPPKQVFEEVHRFVRSATLVAHNASFDRNFWTHELSRLNLNAEHRFLCTMLISRRLYPWSPNHKLQTLVELHEIPVKGRHHRALADASMTSGLLLRILDDIGTIYPDDRITPVFLGRYQKTRAVTVKAVPAILSTRKKRPKGRERAHNRR